MAYEDEPPALPRALLLFRVPLLDGEGNEERMLRLAIDTVERLLDANFATLVCCQAGRSRSAGIAAAALARRSGRPFRHLLDEIAAVHACAIHPALFAELDRISHAHS